MAVFVIQENDGVRAGPELEVLPPLAGDTDAQILARKATSHLASGYIIDLQTVTLLDVHKTFDDPGRHPNRVDRHFRIGL